MVLVWVTYRESPEMVGAAVFNTWEEGKQYAERINDDDALSRVYFVGVAQVDPAPELLDYLKAEVAALEGVE
jgi:hypothetical protein